MSTRYPISKAQPSDAKSIASLFSLSFTSPFIKLAYGNAEPSALAETMATRIAENISNDTVVYMVARDSETQDVVSAVQWKFPLTRDGKEGGTAESAEEREERRRIEDETNRKKLPETYNLDLIMDFMVGVRSMQEELLPDVEYHYRLQNVATHQHYRGQGLASKLITHVYSQADEERHCIFLTTGSDNPAISLYKKLGFQEKGSSVIEDLSKYGGEGSHTQVAFIRYPNSHA